MIGDAAGALAVTERAVLVGSVETPRPTERILHRAVPHRLQRLGQARPSFLVKEPWRGDDLVEDEPLPFVAMRAELLRIMGVAPW